MTDVIYGTRYALMKLKNLFNCSLKYKAMKKLFIITLISVLSSFTMMAEKVVRQGDTESALGKYVVEKTADFVEIDGVALPTYTITYQNSDQVIRVAVDIDKNKKVKNFIVLGDNLNLQYRCEASYFGVKKLEKKYVKAGITNSSEQLNNSEYYHQKVLTRSNPSDRDCLGLIACYYPKLVVDFENAFACK
jgi:hypothetical protein